MVEVLIIESEGSVANALSDALSGRGAQSRTTADGTEGLGLARQHKPDLIVLCVELNRVSGYSICNKLKKDPALATVPLILTSSQATEETFEQHKKLKTRAEAYLKKPYRTGQILEIMQKFVSLGGGGAGGDELEVSIDDEVSVEIDDDSDDGLDFSVDLEDEGPALPKQKTVPQVRTRIPAAGKPAAAESTATQSPARSTQAIVSDAQGEKLRAEVRQLRQKVKGLEQTLSDKELEFNDRLLQESTRSRESLDLKKRLTQVEREIGKYKQLAEKAQAEGKRLAKEAEAAHQSSQSGDSERQALTDKLGQLVDKVKSLAAERDELRAENERLSEAIEGTRGEGQSAMKVREKARKAVDIALQLLDETGLAP